VYNIEDEQMYEVTKISKPKLYEAVLDQEMIPGKNLGSKLKMVTKNFSGSAGGHSVTRKIFKKKTYIVVTFVDSEKFNQFINHPHVVPIKNGTEIQELTLTFLNIDAVKPSKTEEVLQDEAERSICVHDIPLKMRAHVFRVFFESFGEIEDIRTFTRGYYQRAIIRYKNKDAVEHFHKVWSLYVVKESLRVYPLNLDSEQIAKRTEHCFKLAGLPKGTKPIDLNNILTQVKAQSCVIPINPRNNQPLTHAYIYFETQEQMDAACTQFFQFEGKSLVWVPKDTQTCHFCGDPDHVIKECDQKSQNVISKLQADLFKCTAQQIIEIIRN